MASLPSLAFCLTPYHRNLCVFQLNPKASVYLPLTVAMFLQSSTFLPCQVHCQLTVVTVWWFKCLLMLLLGHVSKNLAIILKSFFWDIVIVLHTSVLLVQCHFQHFKLCLLGSSVVFICN